MKINNQIKEIDNIERTFKTVGGLSNYQERMTMQVFIDIRNQFDELSKQFQKEIKELQGELEGHKIFKQTGGELAEDLHNAYEEISKEVGWNTQEKCKVKFKDLPKENQSVMLKLAQYIQVKYFTFFLLDINKLFKNKFGDLK